MLNCSHQQASSCFLRNEEKYISVSGIVTTTALSLSPVFVFWQIQCTIYLSLQRHTSAPENQWSELFKPASTISSSITIHWHVFLKQHAHSIFRTEYSGQRKKEECVAVQENIQWVSNQAVQENILWVSKHAQVSPVLRTWTCYFPQ